MFKTISTDLTKPDDGPPMQSMQSMSPMQPISSPVPVDTLNPITTPELNANSIKEKNLEDIKNQCSELISELDSDENPEAIVKKHISKLKQYNELRDIALGLVTMIADQRKLRTTDILEEMKVELSDD